MTEHLSVADFENGPTLGKFDVIFFSGIHQKKIQELLSRLQDKNILTIGESEGFLKLNGIFNFFTENEKLRFEINLEAARLSRIKIKAQLLKLAQNVAQ